jgi:hypothetical protein
MDNDADAREDTKGMISKIWRKAVVLLDAEVL